MRILFSSELGVMSSELGDKFSELRTKMELGDKFSELRTHNSKLKTMNNKQRTTNNEQSGVALILALFSLLFVSLLVVALVDTITIDQQISTNHIRDTQAGFLADAGVEYAVYKLKDDSSYDTDDNLDGDVYPDDPDDYDTVTLGSGSCKVGIPVGAALPKTITSTGFAGNFSRSVQAVISGSGSSVQVNNWRELEEGV